MLSKRMSVVLVVSAVAVSACMMLLGSTTRPAAPEERIAALEARVETLETYVREEVPKLRTRMDHFARWRAGQARQMPRQTPSPTTRRAIAPPGEVRRPRAIATTRGFAYHDIDLRQYGWGGTTVRGKITNRTGTDYRRAHFILTLFDSKERELDSTTIVFQSFRDGKTHRFCETFLAAPFGEVKRFHIAFDLWPDQWPDQ